MTLNRAANDTQHKAVLPLSLVRADLIKAGVYIDGAWEAEGLGTFDVLDPASGGKIAEVADAGKETAKRAVDAAERAAAAWARTTAAERAVKLRRWNDLVIENREDLARIISSEQGKPLGESRAEVDYGSGYIGWFGEEARRSYGDQIPAPVNGRELIVIKEPVGITAIITPWNFPLAMIARKFAPALAAGCTVVAKPASETPLTALALVALAEEAGIPPGVINIITSRSSGDIADQWMSDPRVRKVSFTGSTRVGRILARQGAETLKRLSLELGGDAPFIVFEDADIAKAVAALRQAKFRNAGQACVAANRVYVHSSIYDAFSDAVCAMTSSLSVGSAAGEASDIGPLIHARALSSVLDLIEDAQQAGARLLVGGGPHALGGNFMQPTVLADVSPTMRISCEEIFGPVVALIPFSSEEEVLALANASIYGLAAYVVTNDHRRMWRIARGLESGIVGINEGGISTEVAPFGGVKQSGYGREGSRYGLADYQNIKYICLGGLE